MEKTFISQEELESLRKLQQDWNILTKRWGEISYEQRIIEKELKLILENIDNLETVRQKLTDVLQDKYKFNGSIDLDTGEFTPVS